MVQAMRIDNYFIFHRTDLVERIDEIQGEVDLKCSCCGVIFERKFVDESSCFVIHHIEKEVADDRMGSDYVEENQEIENREQSEEIETEEHEIEVVRESKCVEEDLIQFENGEDLNSLDIDQLFPFELRDPKIEEHPGSFEDEDHEFGDFQIAQMNSQEIADSFHQKTENLIDFGDEEIQTPLIDTEELQDSHSVHEEDMVSIGTHIPVLDSCDEIKHEELSTTSNNLDSDIENGSKEAQGEGNAVDLKNLSVKVEEIEEDKAPETPSGIHSPNPFHKRWLIPKTKDSGAEESFDGSVISETDGGDPVNTTEKLKSALKAERKALRDLYLELEEERNASAVAANETMAMINRLQEEKAAMQMEALQYRRMMEEQSEYDQEAVQLLNELMMKKEKELESYRKKVSDYEKMRTTSVSWSRSEDDEGSSVDLYHVLEDANVLDGDRVIQHPHTPVDSVLDLESALANFEEERVSILAQLKVLEEKLVALSDEEEQHFANVRVIEDHYEEVNNIGFSGQVTECNTNGHMRNGKQPMGKQLLPLFDAISIGVEDDVTVRNGYENGFHPSKFEDTSVMRFELEKKRIDMEEEVDQLYRRLQALEADREFLKHCIGSMKKGDKGMEVLQEILHHLRDLRDVNLRARSYTENVIL
ncbi:hypothetical protein L1987_38796 [Smallanthus sonchifolius]|uniref:Uncharacterized protein n=1 Tax=Smallanthus sonchifolius TaxID=185202 RepID=A0ACB9HK24_9ASTR|nr:hypothetical protein L1987_38796 [Smallanthus sonchifolius]